MFKLLLHRRLHLRPPPDTLQVMEIFDRVVVTGGTSGLGLAALPHLLGHSHKLVLIGRDLGRLQSALGSVPESDHGKVELVVADLAKPQEVASLSPYLDGADLVVFCAGLGITGKTEDIPLDAFESGWRVNFLSAVQLTQKALPSMKQKRRGVLVFVSSGVATWGLPFTSPYASAKAALNNFVESLRAETHGQGIDIVLFSPGPVASRFHENRLHYGNGELTSPPFHGAPSQDVALRLWRAIENRSPQTTLGFKANLARHLKYWLPKLTGKLVASQYRLTESPAPTQIPPRN